MAAQDGKPPAHMDERGTDTRSLIQPTDSEVERMEDLSGDLFYEIHDEQHVEVPQEAEPQEAQHWNCRNSKRCGSPP